VNWTTAILAAAGAGVAAYFVDTWGKVGDVAIGTGIGWALGHPFIGAGAAFITPSRRSVRTLIDAAPAGGPVEQAVQAVQAVTRAVTGARDSAADPTSEKPGDRHKGGCRYIASNQTFHCPDGTSPAESLRQAKAIACAHKRNADIAYQANIEYAQLASIAATRGDSAGVRVNTEKANQRAQVAAMYYARYTQIMPTGSECPWTGLHPDAAKFYPRFAS
jgi:hypothetical protein